MTAIIDRHRAARHPTGSAAQAGLVNAEGNDVGGIFGTAVATMGMLMTTAYILAMDTFGPITDNAGGIAEISRCRGERARDHRRLDSVGNTTKALTKGYAIASASLAAFLLFTAYIDKVNLIQRQSAAGAAAHSSRSTWPTSACSSPPSSAPCWSTSSAAWPSARSAAAQAIIVEVRRQFREMPGIMDYTQRPDYARVVDITTRAALRQMIAPGLRGGRHADPGRASCSAARPWPAC